MELGRERDACYITFEQTDRVIACRFLFRHSLLRSIFEDGCGVFNDTVLQRSYDMQQSMWTSVRLETSADSVSQSRASFRLGRDNLDETVHVPMPSAEPLLKLPELRYAFLKARARQEGNSDVIFTPVYIARRLAVLGGTTLGIRFASKTFHEELILSWILIALAVFACGISMLRERVTVGDVGGEEGAVARMLAIDSLSLGTNLIRYSSKDVTWTRHIGIGGFKVGRITVLENILHNRAIIMGDKMVSLAREGTGMYIADVKRRADGCFVAEKWRRTSIREVQEASAGELPNLDARIE